MKQNNPGGRGGKVLNMYHSPRERALGTDLCSLMDYWVFPAGEETYFKIMANVAKSFCPSAFDN